jgi:RHS repeat-associated protein
VALANGAAGALGLEAHGADATFDNLEWFQAVAEEAVQYSYNAMNQLLSMTGSRTGSFTYDNALRMTQCVLDGVTKTFGYDRLDRLTSLTAAGSAASYGYYGPSWMRSVATLDGAATSYLHDGFACVQQAAGGATTDFMVPGSAPLWQTTAGGTFVYANDGLGSVTGLWGTVPGGGLGFAAKHRYDAFGNLETLMPEPGNPTNFVPAWNTSGPRYRGELYDAHSDQVFLRNRFYIPGLGRFGTADPIGHDGGLNLYGYCAGDPVNRTDPWGLDPPEAIVAMEQATEKLLEVLSRFPRGEKLPAILGRIAQTAITEHRVAQWGAAAVAAQARVAREAGVGRVDLLLSGRQPMFAEIGPATLDGLPAKIKQVKSIGDVGEKRLVLYRAMSGIPREGGAVEFVELSLDNAERLLSRLKGVANASAEDVFKMAAELGTVERAPVSIRALGSGGRYVREALKALSSKSPKAARLALALETAETATARALVRGAVEGASRVVIVGATAIAGELCCAENADAAEYSEEEHQAYLGMMRAESQAIILDGERFNVHAAVDRWEPYIYETDSSGRRVRYTMVNVDVHHGEPYSADRSVQDKASHLGYFSVKADPRIQYPRTTPTMTADPIANPVDWIPLSP